MKKAIAIVSGGLDSVTLAYWLKNKGYDLHILSFNYGQRHKKELEFAIKTAKTLNAKFDVIDLANLGNLLKGSSLTDDIEVPDGHYAAENMKSTVVPNRNAIMLAIAYGIAVSENSDVVATGVHSGDHFIYPDCRPEFIKSFDVMSKLANEGFGNGNLQVIAPFMNMGKHDIVRIGSELGVSYEDTWSCYKGLEKHCGTCGTCIERQEAFKLTGIKDPTDYEIILS